MGKGRARDQKMQFTLCPIHFTSELGVVAHMVDPIPCEVEAKLVYSEFQASQEYIAALSPTATIRNKKSISVSLSTCLTKQTNQVLTSFIYRI